MDFIENELRMRVSLVKPEALLGWIDAHLEACDE
ncbi:hypothetical protein PAP_06045 [Palaeococcus pacificus DY20341]|uniref:Uncharacterized protein n=1 Tax=Palaeococcus pacificus DY20341 TaxID=1343739 RepID=A0A075LTH0_9EURY|nr:hypothetical protein PAP_06045 [Palaeococcus pacificus DY20341]